MIDTVIDIARQAGTIIREGFGKQFDFEYKTNESNLVTEYDQKSEAFIITEIRKQFPGHDILAEESGAHPAGSEYRWVIDPLDGTTNFAHGLPLFSVSIGVQKHGETICGAVYDVMQDTMYAAESGSGAFRNGNPIHVSTKNTLAHSLLVTGFPYTIAQNPHSAFEIFTAITKQSRGIRRLGSAAIDFCYLAAGVFEAFWEVELHPWDMCAGKLLVEEAGGMVTDFTGKQTDIFTSHMVSSNRLVHDELITIISQTLKEKQ